ncbi:alpha/beta fold hydrolase [Actinomadura kijaniata]|uniref:alpha/beta fold hydrolase n=1 Tax=Actinomadura kijaniata TaxID=46161 RepID=UPI003F1DD50A
MPTTVFTTASADGTDVRAYDEGQGPVLLVVGPGMDDGTRTKKLAALLARRFRVLRLQRRRYRLDLKTGDGPCSAAQEVDDVLALARAAGEPAFLYGHSSGGVIALEALAASPSSFAGAVIFEPAAVTGPPLGGEEGAVVSRARAAIAAGRPGRGLSIFMREAVGLPSWQATAAGAFTGLVPRYRRLIPRQIDDLEAMNELGVRLDAYARIDVPVLLLGGDRSPAHLAERLDALEHVLPHAHRVVMPDRDHGADLKAPRQVAHIIETFVDSTDTRP